MAEPTPFERPAWYDDPRVQSVLAQAQGFGQRLNQQVAGIPGTSQAASFGRRLADYLKANDAAYMERAQAAGNQGIRSIAPVIDTIVPQDELSALLTAIPPVRGLKAGEWTSEIIGSQKAKDWGRIRAKMENFTIDPETGKRVLSGHAGFEKGPGQPVLQVHMSLAPESMRGTGAGMSAYRNIVDETLEAGIPFASDTTLSIHSQAIYKALKKRGYSVVENPNTVDMGEGWRYATDHMPIYQVVSKPMLPERATAVSSVPALSTMPTVTHGK